MMLANAAAIFRFYKKIVGRDTDVIQTLSGKDSYRAFFSRERLNNFQQNIAVFAFCRRSLVKSKLNIFPPASFSMDIFITHRTNNVSESQ
jgi:hypothetical protein